MSIDTDAVLLSEYADPACQRLVQSAAYAASCSFAAFFAADEDGLSAVATFRLGPLPPISVDTLAQAAGTSARGPALAPFMQAFCAASGGPIGFMTALTVDGKDFTHGILVVADPRTRPGLSPAQTYVLRTLAAQLAAGVELRELRTKTPCRTAVERLRLLESVVVNANDAVLITEAEPIDRPGPRIVYCNAAFTKTTGYTEAEILGLTPRILQAPDVSRASLDKLRQALQRWEPIEVELLNVKKDGTEFWVELSIVPVADEQGWFTHWVSVQRDVSHRKEAEQTALRARIAEVEKAALEAEIAQRKQTEERLLHAAFHDDLTQLHNRAYLMDVVETSLQNAADPAGSVLFIDLDRFKLVNDSLGHRVGDLLLIEIARRLESCVAPGDVLARVGGDEFAVFIQSQEGVDAAVGTANRIGVAMGRPFKLGQHDLFSLCSIGIAPATAQHAKAEDLLRDADIAMYAAKTRGTGGYMVFKDSMHASTVDALALQTDLRHAISRNEFHLNYQPIYGAVGGTLTGLEALVRWTHPVRGLVPPDQFIPMAEEIGVIRDIGRWVLRTACTQMQQWRGDDPTLDIRISVNTSSDELRDPAFVPELRSVLEETGLGPHQLQLEITESVFLHQPDLVVRVLQQIRALGIRIAIDDFGTGYSSLSYLDQYDVDTLKIDQSFVTRMLQEKRTMPIVEAIVRLGTALQLDIVAEGVETAAQLDELKRMSCGHVQGYLLARPMTVDAVTALLARRTVAVEG